jgi:biopolymer transport protein ExbD
MAKNKRALPEINAGSMADIAFLLLIFFLVTTTMDVDSGINRKLPEWIPPETDPPPIKKKNIFTVVINSNDQILAEDEYMDIKDLRDAAKRFLINNGDGTCDFCAGGARNPASSDNPNKAIISLVNDRGTSYELFIAVQNELTAAYSELRDELAQRTYGVGYNDINAEQQEQMDKAFPLKISEAEPVNLGG